MALIIAEWGDPLSPDLGPPVYCTIRDADGHAVEEVGENPLGTGATARECQECA